jgi:hypothetical protein
MQIQFLFDVALAAHDRSFFTFEMTAFTVQMKGPSQARLSVGRFFLMAL